MRYLLNLSVRKTSPRPSPPGPNPEDVRPVRAGS